MTKQLWQFNESPQRLNDTAREVVSLRHENRFLKVGLIFCLAITVALYLTACQSQSLGAKEGIYQRLSRLEGGQNWLWGGYVILLVWMLWGHFVRLGVRDIEARIVVAEAFGLVRDKELVMSIIPTPTKDGLFFLDKNQRPIAVVGISESGGIVGVYHKTGVLSATLTAIPSGGAVSTADTENKSVAVMGAQPFGGMLSIRYANGSTAIVMAATITEGAISIKDLFGAELWRAP